jgi:methyl-accepting chemotaxis protein
MYAVPFLNRLRLPQKFLLLGVIGLLMTIIPATLYLHETNKAMRSYDAGKTGLPAVATVLKAVQLMQQHRGLSAVLLNGGNVDDRRQAKQAEVDKAMQDAATVVAQTQDAELQKLWEAIKPDWENLRSAVSGKTISPADSFANHSGIIARLMRVNDLLGDFYSLSLDTDKASYYLTQSMYYQLPGLTEELGKLRARGSSLLTKKNGTPEERQAIAILVTRASDRLQQMQNDFSKTKGNARFDALASSVKTAADTAAALMTRATENIVKPEELSAAPDEFFAAATQAIDALYQLNGDASKLLAADLDDRIATFRKTQWSMLAALAVLLAVAGMIGTMIARSVTKPLNMAIGVARRVASGNLVNDFDVGPANEIGQMLRALRDMNDSLRGIVGEVRGSVDAISTATSDIASGNADLSRRLEAQAANLEETASSMEELTATVRQNVDNAGNANTLVQTAAGVAQQGNEVVSQFVGTMSEIDASSRKIVDIIAVIDSIAFQTNILALNAAVEAARAGEQGRGFAVVATEVRTLAQRAAAAAREIKDLIDQSVNKVAQGNALADKAGNAMNDILQSVGSVTVLMQEIAQASAEQRSGIEQINAAVVKMDEVTQHNATLVEQTAAASASLEQQAQGLVSAMSVFKLSEKAHAPRLHAIPANQLEGDTAHLIATEEPKRLRA